MLFSGTGTSSKRQKTAITSIAFLGVRCRRAMSPFGLITIIETFFESQCLLSRHISPSSLSCIEIRKLNVSLPTQTFCYFEQLYRQAEEWLFVVLVFEAIQMFMHLWWDENRPIAGIVMNKWSLDKCKHCISIHEKPSCYCFESKQDLFRLLHVSWIWLRQLPK